MIKKGTRGRFSRGQGDGSPVLMVKDTEPSPVSLNILYSQKYSDIIGSDISWVTDVDQAKELASKAKAAGFSYYGLRNPREFVAEAFAQYYCAESPGEITKSIIDLLLGG